MAGKRTVDKKPNRDYYADLRSVRLGPKPFRIGISYYTVRKEAYLTKLTIEENTRKLLMFAEVFEDLRVRGRVKTTDPRHISELDIEAFLKWMMQRGLQNVTKTKYIGILDSYLGFFGNHILSDMKRQNKIRFPVKTQNSDIEYIDEDDLRTIFKHISTYPGYNGIIIRGFFALIFGIAGRPKEVINGLVEDVNLEDKRFYVRHPKGEGSWGKSEWIPIIRGDMIPKIESFLRERSEYLKKRNIESIYLFPNPKTDTPYAANTIRKIKEQIEEDTGVDFKLKDFRSTYATLTYKYSPELKEAIRKQMRHENSKTTDRYYISVDHREAAKRLENEWTKSKID